MTDDKVETERSFLRRWSQRKLAASREATAAASTAAPASATVPATAATPAPSTQATVPSTTAQAAAPELPPIESLTIDSDFTVFLQPSVDPGVRQAALRKLFSDPHFNVMDGLDVYIDDYNKFEPIPAELVQKLAHARYLFDPPKTRVNAQGYVEDVPVEEAAAAAAAARDADKGDAQAVASPQRDDPPRSDAADAVPDATKDSRSSDVS